MPDAYTLRFQNFRSLRDVEVDIAPLTVVYGPNGSGKSSLIYGLLTLKNFLTNPNQNVPSLFSYPSISLGGLTEVVHRHTADKNVSFSIGISNPEDLSSKFTLTVGKSGGAVEMAFDWPQVAPLVAGPNNMSLDIAVPYEGNQQATDQFVLQRVAAGTTVGTPGSLMWNGVALTVQLDQEGTRYVDIIKSLNEKANLPMELARRTGFVPLRRGFSKPTYGMSNVNPHIRN